VAHRLVPGYEESWRILLAGKTAHIAELESALDSIRDSVLNEHGPMAEGGFTNDQVNSVLSIIDDADPRAARASVPKKEGESC
jgi:hypothetical protein